MQDSQLTAGGWSRLLPGTVGVPGHVDMTRPHLATAGAVHSVLQATTQLL